MFVRVQNILSLTVREREIEHRDETYSALGAEAGFAPTATEWRPCRCRHPSPGTSVTR